MKIIHTSDWHIGQTLYQYSRDDEHLFFFEQLRDIILEEKPDALVVSGDIFHSATPNVVSQRIYYHALVELSRLYEDMQIIVVAGNHDSPSRLEAPRELWSAFNVTVVGNLDFYKNGEINDLPYDVSKIQIPIKRNDEIIGWVLAVPYINPGNYPSLDENDTFSNRVFTFYKNLNDNLKSNPQYKENHSVVALGHMMVAGVDLKNKDNMVGGMEIVDSSGFSSLSDIDYWALGHVHHPQSIRNNERMRYSGSPFAMTFNECYQHSVTVVNIENHKVDVAIKDVAPMIPIFDFPAKPESYEDALTVDEVKARLTEILDDVCYVRLHVKSEIVLSDLVNADIIRQFENKKARFCGIQSYLPVKETDDKSAEIRSLEDFKSISPYELGCSVFERKNGVEMPEEMKMMFKEVCDEVMK